jgi:soluble lytic murein transglycosylase-like protein
MDLNKLAAMANKLSIPQLQQAIQSGALPAYIGVPMLQKRVQDSKQAQMAQQAQQAPQAQAPIADQVMQEAQGIAGVESNLPQEYADGGIVAFAGGGSTNPSKVEYIRQVLGEDAAQAYLQGFSWPEEQLGRYGQVRNPNVPTIGQAAEQRIVKPTLEAISGAADAVSGTAQPFGEAYMEAGVPGVAELAGKNIGRSADYLAEGAKNVGSGIANLTSGLGEKAAALYYGPKGKPRSEVGSRQAGKDEILKYINEAAAANGIDPNLLYGVAMTESSLNPNAKSNKGAMGMMQIMPGTAKELGLTNPYDPRESAFAGAKYLRDLKDRFGDDDLALSGYNMGPNRSIETLKGNTKYTAKVRENMANSPFASATTATQQPAPAAAQLAPPEATQTPFAIPAFDESPYKAAMSSEDEMDARKRMEYMQSLMGEDEGRSAREARMSKKEQEIAKDRDQAKWMALLQASLATMAGTSPFAMANIGAGGIAGLKSYAEDTKDINRAQDKLDELRSSYEDALRAEKRAAAKHGEESAQTAKAHNKAVALQMAKDKAEQEYKWAALGETRAHNEALAKYYGRPTAAASGGAFDTVFYRNLLSQVMENPKAYPEYTTNGQVDHRKIANHVKQLTNPQATGLEAIMADFGAKNGVGGAGTSIKEPEQTGANTYRYGYN